MAHIAQRVMVGLVIAAQAIFGGAPASAQLFVPPPKSGFAALEPLPPLVAAVDPIADAPALASTAGAQEIEPVIPTLAPSLRSGLALSEVEGPALTVSVLTPRGRVLNGENITLTLLVEAPALVRNATISLTLPDGLDAVSPRAAAGVIAVNDLDIDRRRFVQAVARVNSAVVPMSLRLRVEASAPGLAPEAIRAVDGKLAIYGDRVAQRVSAAGGRAAFGERIVMSFAANALSRDTDIELSAGPTNAEPEDEFDPVLAFEAGPSQAFRAPVTVTLALSGLLRGRAAYGAEPVLRYWKVSEDGRTRTAERVPATFDPATSELVARLEHFSQYDVVLQTPQDPKPWQMVSNLGGVNAFRGTTSIAIPIDVPPMQDGLEPKLALQYSSGGAERQSDSAGGAGMGWSLDTPVVQQRVTLVESDWSETCGNGTCWFDGTALNDANDYTLLIGGQEYALVHVGGGEFVTERYAPLRIWYCASQTSCQAPHAPGPRAYITETFWVWSADGTLSVFGGEVETAARMTANRQGVDDADTLTWHLRYVYAAHRDDPGQAGRWSAKYTYAYTLTDLNRGAPYAQYRLLKQVEYGNSLGSAARHAVNVGYVNRWPLAMPMKYQPVAITVTAGETGEAIWRYALEYGQFADRYVLTRTTRIAADGSTLPATTFDYSPVCIDGASPCKTATLMTRVSNGYGGTVAYAFEPGPTANAAERRVVTETTSDGATDVAVRTFQYSQPCKNENNAVCRTYHDFGPSGYLMGYGVVTTTARDSANATLRISVQRFYTDALRLGMEGSSVTMDAAGAAGAAQTADWDALGCDAGWPDGSWLVTALTSTSFLAGDASSALFRRTAVQTGLTRTNCARISQVSEGSYAFDKASWTDRKPTALLWQGSPTSLLNRWGILRDPAPGAAPLYLCGFSWTKPGNDKGEHTFLSRQADCSWPGGSYGGSQATAFRYGTGLAGYIYSTTNGIYTQPLILCLRGNDNYNSYHDLVAGTSCPAYSGASSNFVETLGYVSPDTPTAASLAGVALKTQAVETAESDPSGVARRSASASAVLSTTARWAVVGISQTVRDGAGNLLDETRAFYDDLPTFGAVDKGDLTFVQKRATGDASIDRKLSYDDSGALESEMVYADYGTLGVMTNTSGVLRRTSNVFDSGTGMYVTQQRVFGADTAPQTRTVNYAYFGVGGESVTNTLGARQPVGALKVVTDANQAVTVYAYDTFGRLRKIARPGDSLADPSEEWRYFDGIETSRTMTASGFTAGPFVTDHRVRGVAGGGWTLATIATLDRTIYDGLGRVIQTQTRAGQGWQLADCADSPRKTLGTEVIQSTLYDALGRAAIQSVPYTQTQYESCASPGSVNTPYVGMPQTQTQPSGTGLAAVYYNGMNLETAVLNRTDAGVDFNWGSGSPGSGVPSDQFSARWTGWVRVDASATYTLYAAGDDGIRLWINGQLVVDQWHDQGGNEYAAVVALQAGVYHEVKFEYYENTGGALARLKWASPTLAKQVIPTTNLYVSRMTPVVTPTVPYVRTAYDALGRPITVTAPDGSVSVARYGLDASGPGYTGTNLALKTMIDPNGHQKQQVSDGLGRLVRVREFTGTGGGVWVYGETRYAYDPGDRLTTVTDTLGNLTTIAYDALGRKAGMVDPDMGAWSYGYNAQGQLITQTDALGQTLVFTYDSLGRMTAKGVGGASPGWLASYLYDQGANAIGRRARMTDTTGYTAWSYDARGQVTMTQKLIAPNPAAYVTKFGYDDANRLITTTYLSSEVVTNTFDLAGKPNSLYAGGSPLVASATYNALGQPRTINFGNGVSQRRYYGGLDTTLYVQWGKMRQLCVVQTSLGECADDAAPGRGGTGTMLFNAVYGYDAGGNVTAVDDRTPGASQINEYVYDSLDRLTEWRKVTSWSPYSATTQEAYTYSPNGNLTGRYGVGATGAITYPTAGSARPHAATATANGNSYAYDANGNMTLRTEVSGTETFVYTQTWTIDNRLIGVTKALTSGAVLARTSYAFDGDGVRVRKEDPDGIVLYIGATEVVIGAPGTAAIEYYDDTQAGTFSFLNYTKTVVSATTGISYAWGGAPPLAGMDGAPWALRWNQWVSVTQAGLYTVTAIADDGVGVSIAGVSVIYSLSIRDTAPLTAGVGVSMAPGNLYQLQVSYLNYTNTNGASFRLLWTRPDGVTEEIPASALRTRGRRDYYSFGGAVVAMKEGVNGPAPRTLTYLHGDHLGSVSLTTDASGNVVSQQRYKPYGEVRWSSAAGMPTDFTFTSQRASSYGTIFMSAREYLPSLGRFLSADSIVPGAGNPQALNRYAYVFNSPLGFVDPSGHDPAGSQNNCNYSGQGCGGAGSQTDIETQHIILAGTQWWYDRQSAQSCADHPVECTVKTVVNGVFMVLPIGLVGVAVLPSFLTSYAATKVAVAGVAAAETVVAACGGDCKDEVDSARMTVERIVPRGTSVAQVIEYMKMRTFQTGNEYGLVRLTSGERAIVSGNELSINLSENVERLIAHTHGYQYGPTGPSSLDIDALRKLGQFSSYLIERGDVTRFFVKPTK